jgi:hypothetical protein
LGSDGALSYAINTVHVHGVQLSDAMPVDASTIACHVVDNLYVDGLSSLSDILDHKNIWKEVVTDSTYITPTSLDIRTRESIIDEFGLL